MKNILRLFCLIILLSPAAILSQSSAYKVTGKINIGGEGWWDYASIDASLHRLYISHASKIHVIDLGTDKIINEIDNLNGVHGIVFADEFEKGFISNGGSSIITVVNLKNLKTIDKIKVTGKDPDAIVYDSYSKRLFTMNGRSSNVTVIDAKTNNVIGTIKLDGRPEFAVANEKGLIYVNLEDKSQIEVLNTSTLKTIKTWSLAPGKSPSGLAIDLRNNILFSGCHNNLMVIVNANTGKVITTLPIGSHVDGCAFDPGTNLAFSSNGEGSITIIKEESPEKFKVVDNIQTEKGLRTMALDPVIHKIYLSGMLEGNNNEKNFGVLVLEKK